jgi:hypothetical protein
MDDARDDTIRGLSMAHYYPGEHTTGPAPAMEPGASRKRRKLTQQGAGEVEPTDRDAQDDDVDTEDVVPRPTSPIPHHPKPDFKPEVEVMDIPKDKKPTMHFHPSSFMRSWSPVTKTGFTGADDFKLVGHEYNAVYEADSLAVVKRVGDFMQATVGLENEVDFEVAPACPTNPLAQNGKGNPFSFLIYKMEENTNRWIKNQGVLVADGQALFFYDLSPPPP